MRINIDRIVIAPGSTRAEAVRDAVRHAVRTEMARRADSHGLGPAAIDRTAEQVAHSVGQAASSRQAAGARTPPRRDRA